MSTISLEKQHTNADYYGPSGPFVSQKAMPLVNRVLGFSAPEDLARAEGVCRSWNVFIVATDQWKKQCQNRLNIPTSINPKSFLPKECDSYKKGIQLASTQTKVYDARIYRSLLGAEIELVSPFLEAIPLTKSNQPDPCNPTKSIGRMYVWIDSPSCFKILVDGNFPFELDKPDDPNNEEAPRLIERKVGLGSKSEKKLLKVPNTINNLGVLFKHPKNGHPSTYDSIWPAISDQHGNKRIPQGRICIREDLIRKSTLKAAKFVVSGDLGHRILFNFIRHAETNIYPDGQNPWTFACTSTRAVGSEGIVWPSVCGGGGPSGLKVGCITIGAGSLGDAVALPPEVQEKI